MASREAATLEEHREAELARRKTRRGFPNLDHAKAAVLTSLSVRWNRNGAIGSRFGELIGWYSLEPCLSFNKTNRHSRLGTGQPTRGLIPGCSAQSLRPVFTSLQSYRFRDANYTQAEGRSFNLSLF
jgi:hypothetical protein